jgi:hypothetical protein
MLSVADNLSSSRQELRGEQGRVWTQAVQDVGLDLDSYACKASYVCGMLRQFIEVAGLQLGREYHVEALVSAASGAELLGWCYEGDPENRLRDGVEYLEAVGPPYIGSVHHPAANLADWVCNVRNFGAHGAAPGKHLALDRVLTVWLLRSLARALDIFWINEGDRRRHECFARVAIIPLYTEGKPIFVRDVQHHLAKRLMPERSWTTRRAGGPANLGRSRRLRGCGRSSLQVARRSRAAYDGCLRAGSVFVRHCPVAGGPSLPWIGGQGPCCGSDRGQCERDREAGAHQRAGQRRPDLRGRGREVAARDALQR